MDTNRRWLPFAVLVGLALGIWAVAAAYGCAWQLIWLPAAIAGAAWPRHRKLAPHQSLRRLRRDSGCR